ncbi:hypothetical protein [Pseudomonas sp. CFBP 13719]|uniref:hypothetical protein n=1 Tax=Pseudomonas sp. CFBP 13719 TaxID=2775303 RepID=UPI001781F384|nr:hypothetical protein [Pseudomonas sp. CFBP 13719]MBD8680284.1 hypothetical protein [Pseudomonas sp. CFBP 13719]
MADQTQRLEIATVKAEVGSNILYLFSNAAENAQPIVTESGEIRNLKQVIAAIQEDGAEKISVATTIYQTAAAGLAATADGGIYLVQSGDADKIYTVWRNQAGAAVNTGKTAMSSQAIQDALAASNDAAQAAEDAADVATNRTAGLLQPSALAPAARDNGLPLQVGDRYFNTASQAEYIYSANGWAANDSIEALEELKDGLGDKADTSKGIALVSLYQFGAAAPGQERPIKKGFWTDTPSGANLWRFRDRILVGAAAQANGADDPGSDKTWVGYTSGGLMTYFETRSTAAIFSDNGVIAGAFASRSSDQDVVKGGPCIAVAGLAYNNRANKTAWGGYFTAVKDNDTVMYTHGAEVDIANRGSVVDINPYNMTVPGQTVAAWLRTGGETAESGQAVNPASACMGVVGSVSSNPNAVFRKGIVFAANAIQVDATGKAPAIVLARNQKIEWVLDGSGSKAGELRSDATSSTNRLNASFNNNGFSLFSVSSGGSEVESFRFIGSPTAANFLEFRPANSGGRPTITVQGNDANIDAAIAGKGSGGVRLRDGAGSERIQVNTNGVGFFGSVPISKPTVSGSKSGNVALDNLLKALADYGLISNSTS